jgi:hypothetical protein
MPAPKGHPLWGNPRKPKKYTPDELWEGAIDYFNWSDENPIMIIEQSKMPQRLDAKMVKELKPAMIKSFLKQTIDLPHQRAYTIEGLCIHLNISRETFDNYSKTKGYETYFDICKRVREIIDNQHLQGGMAGIFNANIVTRKLGLQEKIATSQKIIITPMDNEEAKELNKLFNEEN